MIFRYSKEAKDRIRSLPPEVKRGVRESLEGLREDPCRGKPLQRELAGFWSLAFKRYRIIFKPCSGGEIQVYTIGERRRIYEDFSASLVRQR